MPRKINPKVAIVVAVAVVAAAATLLLPRFLRPDFRKGLARQLNVDPDVLHLNIPPSPQRYPGFAFVMQGSMLQVAAPLERSQLNAGPTFELQWADLSKSDASSRLSGGPFRGIFSSDTDDKVSLNLHNCRVLETDVSQLKQRLLGVDSILKQADKGAPVLVITRAFEGQMEMKLQRGARASGEVWSEKVKLARSASSATANGEIKVSTANDDQLIVQWSEPVVFAFEAVEAKLFASHLGTKPDKVDFKPVGTSELLKMALPETGGGDANSIAPNGKKKD